MCMCCFSAHMGLQALLFSVVQKYTLKTCPGDFAVSLESEERRRHLKNSETCLARLYVELGQEQTVVLQAPWVLQQATLSVEVFLI